MAPTEQTAVLLADSLRLSLVPERFVTDLFGDAGDQGSASLASAPWADELNMDLDADETEPCVAAASVEVLMELNDLLQTWCTREDAEEFWALFSTHDAPVPTETLPGSVARPKQGAITVRRLIAILNKLVGLGDPYSIHRATRGLHAAVAYLRLPRVKGSRAYGGFNSLAFQAVVRFLGEYPKLLEPSNIQHDADSVDVSYDEMEVVDAQAVVRETRKDVARCFEIAVKELELLASSVSLREFHEEALQIAEFFAGLTSVACKLKKFEDKMTLERCRSLAYRGLTAILSPRHGQMQDILSQTFRALISNILMLHNTKAGPNFSADKESVKSNKLAAKFVKSAIDKLHSEGDSGASTNTSYARVDDGILDKELHRMGVVLLQQICIRVPDRAEVRGRVAEAVRDIFEVLSKECQAEFMAWIHKYSRNTKPAYRAFALDVIAALIGVIDHKEGGVLPKLDEDDGDDSALGHPALGHPVLAVSTMDLLLVLVGRGTDKSPTVRSRAVSVLAKIVEKGVTDGDSRAGQLAVTFLNDLERALPTGITISQMIINRSDDEKSAVRRPTISLVRALLNLEIHLIRRDTDGGGRVALLPLSGKLLECLPNRTRDPVMSVRKGTITTITDLVELCPEYQEFWNLWLDNVPPAAIDQERAIQEEAAACVCRLFVDPVQPGDRAYCRKRLRALDGLDESMDGYVRKLVLLGLQKRQVAAGTAHCVQKIALEDMNSQGPWRLLAAIAEACLQVLDYAELLLAWENLQKDFQNANSKVCANLLEIIGILSRKISEEEARRFQGQLLCKLAAFEVCPALISTMITTIQRLDVGSRFADWRSPLLERCEEFLTRSVLQTGSGEDRPPAHLDRYLCTATVVAQFSPSAIPEKLVIAMQAMVASDAEKDGIIPAVRAQAFVSLGKLCLQNEDYAKRLVSAFARELETSKDFVVRNNVMVVLSDLCTRYTRLVDPYIPKVACCLRDESHLVRRQTLAMLTRLLQEDYLKWKGTLFFKFVSMVVDENEDTVEFAKFCLCHVLPVKYPNMFFNFFVDTILFLNGHTDRGMAASSSQQDRELFAMIGEGENKTKRRNVYRFLLQNMVDEQRFQLTAKLCTDILGAAVDDTLDISDPNKASVLVDALFVLSSKDIKISMKPPKDAGDGSETDDAVKALAAQARTNILSKISRKNTIENMLPVIIELKHRLERERSSLLQHLMGCLREIAKDFRVEMNDICAGDRRLANELEFDLRHFEEQEQAEKRQEQQSRRQGQREQPERHVDQAQGCPAAGEATPFAPDRRRTIQRSPKRHRGPPSALRAFKTPLSKLLFTPAGSHANRSAFTVPRLNTVQRRDMTDHPGSLVRQIQASTPSAQGARSSKPDVSRTLDLSGIGGGITPIRCRRSTLASINVGTPRESPIVVGYREFNDETNSIEDAGQAQQQLETTICNTPVRWGKGRAAGTSGWNVNSPMPPRSNNLRKRRSTSREPEGGSEF